MKNVAQRYLNDARNGAGREYRNFVDEGNGMNNFVGQPYFNADGGNGNQAVKPSMPYSITVSSASGSAIQNFDVLGATENLNNPNVTFNAAGDLVVGSVTISSGTPNITYRDLLYQTLTQVFTVGSTYLTCSNVTAQILQAYSVTTKDSNGSRLTFPVKPKKDPNQNQTDVIYDTTVYRIDGFTKLTFANILPNAVLSIDWYPQDNVNPGRMLNGQNPGKAYGSPGVVRSQVVVVPGGGGQSNFNGPTIVKTRY